MQHPSAAFIRPPIGVILAALLAACGGRAAIEAAPPPAPPQDAAPAAAAVEPPPPETAPAPAPAPRPIALREGVPERYVVKKGDTLWDIAAMFLEDPWRWPEIWYFNPQIDNPHLIYPGDVLTLVYVGGRPQLRLSRGGARGAVEPAPSGLPVERLSPRVRARPLDQAIPTLPMALIEPFLVEPRIVDPEDLERAAYIVSSRDQHLVAAAGNTVYARRMDRLPEQLRYHVFRPNRPIRDPDSGEVLGYEALMVSEARLLERGDPARLEITRSLRETLNGDRVLPAEAGRRDFHFLPHGPKDPELRGRIAALVDNLFQTGKPQVVVLDLGERDGVDPGTVFEIRQDGGTVRDPYADSGEGDSVTLPQETVGLVMVFRVFERLSYGLVMESSHPIRVGDHLRAPQTTGTLLAR